jgi:hypothetical protein
MAAAIRHCSTAVLFLLVCFPSALTIATPIAPMVLKSACACGKVTLQITMPPAESEPNGHASCFDCHCANCRRYHDSAFVSFLQLQRDNVSMETRDDAVTETYVDSCSQFGSCERVFCRDCSSKLMTRLVQPGSNDASEKILINLGSVEDSSIPKSLSQNWKKFRIQYRESSTAPWLHAKPRQALQSTSSSGLNGSSKLKSGSCACRKHTYQILSQEPLELQHCYCKLCRQLSGGPFMTRIPVYNEDFLWNEEPPLVRTTSHGQRHICSTCRSVMTIVYDEQSDVVWPVAGSLEDESVSNTQEYERVIHICCRYKQPWYQLPNDGLERVQEAC